MMSPYVGIFMSDVAGRVTTPEKYHVTLEVDMYSIIVLSDTTSYLCNTSCSCNTSDGKTYVSLNIILRLHRILS